MCRAIGGTVSLSLLFFLSMAPLKAQDLPASLVSLLEQREDQTGDAEAWVQYYERLMQHPLNLNAASRRQLEETGLLSLFQVESVLAWRERYGAIRSATELSFVEGFSAESVAGLRPFFSFGEPSSLKGASQTYSARFKKKWKKAGFSVSSKGIYDSEAFSAAAVIDNDPQERFPDFVSVSARYKGFYAGDFTVRFGQGLVLWKAFSLTAFGTPSSLARRGNGLQVRHSSSETGYFRGAGWSGEFGRFSASAFVSRTPVDARVVDGKYTSIATDGLHATEAERAKRHAMHEYVAGTNLSYDAGRWHFGLTAAAYTYDKHNGRRVQEYNRCQQYDGPWGNLSVDFQGSLGSLRLFGEVAVDAHFAPAVLAGAIWSPSYSFETSLQLRCYSPSYIATHAGAWSTLSSVSNQIGATYAVQAILGAWTLRLNADVAWYPWKRYREEAGGWGFKARLQAVRIFPGGAEGEVQLAWSSRPKAKLRITLPFGDAWQCGIRAEANTGGVAGYAEVRWKPSRRWDVSARATLWSTKDWDSRICFYERGVPESFLVENYYRKGIGAYLVVKYAPTRNLEFWAKVQQGYCAYFVRIFIPG